MNDDSIRLVEVEVDEGSFAEAHVRGALRWDWIAHLNTAVRRDILGGEEMSRLLGHGNARNYDGSWTEYGSMIGAPIEL